MKPSETEPLPQEVTIRPYFTQSLQEQLEVAIKNGIRRIILEGKFTPDSATDFSLIHLKAHHNLEIIGGANAVLDGQDQVNHLIFLDSDAELTIKDVTLTGGSTKVLTAEAVAADYHRQKLNIFQYLDGAAVNIGPGAALHAYDCLFLKNQSGLCGGAISNLGGWADLHRCRFTGNRAEDTGAAIDNLGHGSLATVFKCVFEHNQANLAGGGNHGAITAFKDTFLFMTDNDFSKEYDPVIDYWLHLQKLPRSILIGRNNQFRSSTFSTVENPISNRGMTRLMVSRFIQLRNQGYKVKFEGRPTAPPDIREKHQAIFDQYYRQYHHLT